MNKSLQWIGLMMTTALAVPMLHAEIQYATTIDYLDYVFYDNIGPQDHYSLESYEQRIRELAECGITQINLRTNCMGVALHPSKILPRYGEDGRWHYTERKASMRLIETLKRYDPLAETIRLGHKYGLKVWCWENISDESFNWDASSMPDAETTALCRKYNGYPLLDPFLRDHEECWAWLKAKTPEERQRDLEAARRYPVARMVITAYVDDRPPINFGKADLNLYVSDDNETWTRYEGPWEFSCSRDAKNHNSIEVNGLNITARYIKLAPKKAFGPSHPFTLTLKGRNFGKLYNTQGEEVVSDWGCHIPGMNSNQPESAITIDAEYPLHTVLSFDRVPSMGFDARNRQIGCAVGGSVKQVPFVGMLEFCSPVTREHKWKRYKELADYPFDGYILTMNCHSNNSNADEYSYNPAVRERIMARTGKDIMTDDVPLEELIRERRDGLSEYVEGCKTLIGARPLVLEGWGPDWKRGGLYGRDNYGSIVPDYPRLIQKGTLDGVLMYHDFADYFTDAVTGGRKIQLGMYYDLNAGVFFVAMGKQTAFKGDFAAAMKDYAAKGYFTTIDLYETLILSHRPAWQDIVKQLTH